jgi:hypothetical protein
VEIVGCGGPGGDEDKMIFRAGKTSIKYIILIVLLLVCGATGECPSSTPELEACKNTCGNRPVKMFKYEATCAGAVYDCICENSVKKKPPVTKKVE